MFYLDFLVFYVQTVHLVIKKFYILSIMLTLVHSVSCRILVAEYRPILGVPRCFALGEKTERNIARVFINVCIIIITSVLILTLTDLFR